MSRPPTRRLPRLVIAAALVAAAVAACGGDPEVPGNRWAWFAAALAENRYPDAHAMLCEDLRNQISAGDFAQSRGAAVSPVLPNSGFSGLHGDSAPRPSPPDREATRTSVEVVARRYRNPLRNGAPVETNVPVEHWIVDLTREGDQWKVCALRPK